MFRQRGYTPYGVEHAKDNPELDLKNFGKQGIYIEHSQVDTTQKFQPQNT